MKKWQCYDCKMTFDVGAKRKVKVKDNLKCPECGLSFKEWHQKGPNIYRLSIEDISEVEKRCYKPKASLRDYA